MFKGLKKNDYICGKNYKIGHMLTTIGNELALYRCNIFDKTSMKSLFAFYFIYKGIYSKFGMQMTKSGV